MSIAQKAIKGSVLIALGETTGQVCSLIRNVLLARVLTKEDFGIAALLGMTVTMFELGGRLSIEHCVVQSPQGDDSRFLGAAHFLQASLGAFSGLLILVFAPAAAALFKVPDAVWALQLLSVLPVLKGLTHFGVFQMTRTLNFRPFVLIDAIPQLVITALAVPLVYFWKSYAVLVWLLIIKQLAATAGSFVLARSAYRWAFDRAAMVTILRFGWPMLFNGVLLFAIMQGDRFAIGVGYSATELGPYAIAGSISLLPAAMLLKLSGNILLPVMSAIQNDQKTFVVRVRETAEVLSLFSGAYALLMILAGESLVGLIFGPHYADVGSLVLWLALAQAIRLLRNTSTIAAMARGDTQNLLFSNLLRLIGVGLAFPLAAMGASLSAIAACGAIGEAIALVGSFIRLSRKHQIPVSVCLAPFGLATAFILISALLSIMPAVQHHAWLSLPLALAVGAFFLVLHFFRFASTKRLLSQTLPAYLHAR